MKRSRWKRPATEPKTITIEESLERCKQGCADPSCTTPAEQHDVMYIEQLCHDAPTATYYDSVYQHVIVECAYCGKEVARWKITNQTGRAHVQ